MTSNREPGRWGETLGDATVAAVAMIDRLVHLAEVVNLKGDSYRGPIFNRRRGANVQPAGGPLSAGALTQPLQQQMISQTLRFSNGYG